MFEEKQISLPKEEWNFEEQQNWDGFWNLLLQEDIRQNPHLYKKIKEAKND